MGKLLKVSFTINSKNPRLFPAFFLNKVHNKLKKICWKVSGGSFLDDPTILQKTEILYIGFH